MMLIAICKFKDGVRCPLAIAIKGWKTDDPRYAYAEGSQPSRYPVPAIPIEIIYDYPDAIAVDRVTGPGSAETIRVWWNHA